MSRKDKSDYEGTYRIQRSPVRMKRHNADSWQKIERVVLRNNGQADFDTLAIAVKDHKHGTKSAAYPYQFIIYCIKREWLKRVK